MENTNKESISDTVSNILTLRYDPTQHSLLPKLTWSDFTPDNQNPSIDFIERLIQDNLKKNIGKEEKVSIALSGGVDSTLVLTILRKLFPDVEVNAISIKFSDSVDETPFAARIANELNATHEVVKLDNYLSELPKAISIIGLPFWDIHWYYVAKKANTISKVLLAGDGGDELFGGYTFRYKKFLTLTNSTSRPLEKIKAYLDCHERDRVPDQENLFGTKVKFSWNSVYNNFNTYFDNPLSPIDQVFLSDFNGKLLYNFLPVNTALHAHFGLHAVAPIVSSEMIQYVTHIPNNMKYDPSTDTGKILLRKLLSKYNMDKKIVTEMVNDIIEDKITQFIENISSDEFIEEVTDRVIQGGVPVENEEEVEEVREIIGSKVVSFITKQILSTNDKTIEVDISFYHPNDDETKKVYDIEGMTDEFNYKLKQVIKNN